jgi:asparagine synthase (glutamine-hydrolysing)
LTAYSVIFPGHPEDESELARQVAQKAGVRHVTTTYRPSSLWERLERFIDFQDGPTGGIPNVSSAHVFKEAREDGSVVVLNGQGGDELLGGYYKFYLFWLQMLARRGRWIEFARTATTYLLRSGFKRWDFSQARRYFPSHIRDKVRSIRSFATPGCLCRVGEQPEIGAGKDFNERLWKDLSRYSLPCLLHWEDRNSMSVSVEARLPLLDHRIAEAVFDSSVHTKLRDGYAKYSIRELGSTMLPSAVCWEQRKRGFATPGTAWLRNELAEPAREVIFHRDSELGEFFDLDSLRENHQAFVSRGDDSLTHKDWFRILGFSIWTKQLKLGPAVPEPAFS